MRWELAVLTASVHLCVIPYVDRPPQETLMVLAEVGACQVFLV